MAMDLSKLLNQVKAQKANIEARKVGGEQIAKIPAGKSRWRILPGWRENDPETFSHDFGQHWIKDEKGEVVAVYVCEFDTFGNPCDLDDVLRKAIASTKDDDTVKALKEMTSRRSVLVNAVQTAGPQADPNKPVLLALPPTSVFDPFLTLLAERMNDDINLLDLAEGREIIIDKTGTGLNTRYSVADGAKAYPLDPSVMQKLINIDAWIEGQKQRGMSKGIAPLNTQVARVLGMTVPSGTAGGLVSSKTAIAAAAAPSVATPAAIAAAAAASATPWEDDAALPAAKAAPAPAGRVEVAADASEIERLLADIAGG